MGRVACILALMLSACSYASPYRAPLDGRARAVWHQNKVRAHLGEVPAKECNTAVNEAIDGSSTFPIARDYNYAPPPGQGVGVAIVYTPFIWYVPFVAVPLGPFPASTDWLRGAYAAFVIALVVLPIVDVALAAADPEDADVSTLSIDTVNAFNDLARSEGSPCAH